MCTGLEGLYSGLDGLGPVQRRQTVLLTSSERVHERLLGDCAGVDHLLGLADLSVGLGELQPDGLGQVRVKPHSLL